MEEIKDDFEKDFGEMPHKHASKRLVVGVAALFLLTTVGFFVWLKWGSEIKDVCIGENGVCSVDL